MSSLIERISSYNIFNYLFPGIVFAILIDRLTSVDILRDDLLEGVFLYYFLGMVISRLGSLVVEPSLRKIKLVRFGDYEDFINASQKDEKIELLSEVNNTYRTLTSGFLLLTVFILFDQLLVPGFLSANILALATVILLLLLFLFSYRKQTDFIRKRIKAAD